MQLLRNNVRGWPPFVSVIIRSFERPGPLLELVDRVRSQAYPRFEIVILEQSGNARLLAALDAQGDARVRVVVSRRRDPPAARNEAVRHARGDVFLFIDDDDLPIGPNWIALHVGNYV